MSYIEGDELTLAILYHPKTGAIMLKCLDKDIQFGWSLEGAIRFRDKFDATIKRAQAALGLEA
jgi:hypothetical protein